MYLQSAKRLHNGHLRAQQLKAAVFLVLLSLIMTACTGNGPEPDSPTDSRSESAAPAKEAISGFKPLDLSTPLGPSSFGNSMEVGKEQEYAQGLAITLMKMGFPIRALDGSLKREFMHVNAVPVPEWQVQMMGAQWPAQHTLKWSDLSNLLNETLGTGSVDWETHLKVATNQRISAWQREHGSELGPLSQEDADKARDWVTNFYSLRPMDGYYNPQEDLSIAQAYVLLKSLGTEILRQSSTVPKSPQAAINRHGARFIQVEDSDSPCVFTPEQEIVIGGGETFVRTFQLAVVKYLVKTGILTELVPRRLNVASTLSNAAEALLAFLVLQVRMDIDKKPLIRTWNSTAGDEGTVTLVAEYKPDWESMSNCLRVAFAVAGVAGVSVPSGPARVSFVPVGKIGFNQVCGAVVGLREGGIRLHTDENGRGSFRVIGLPMMPPVVNNRLYSDLTPVLGVVVSGPDNSFVKDLMGVAGAAASGPGALPQGMITVFSKFRLVTYLFPFALKNPYDSSIGGGIAGPGPREC